MVRKVTRALQDVALHATEAIYSNEGIICSVWTTKDVTDEQQMDYLGSNMNIVTGDHLQHPQQHRVPSTMCHMLAIP